MGVLAPENPKKGTFLTLFCRKMTKNDPFFSAALPETPRENRLFLDPKMCKHP
jgi:hypothetical protein